MQGVVNSLQCNPSTAISDMYVTLTSSVTMLFYSGLKPWVEIKMQNDMRGRETEKRIRGEKEKREGGV